MKIESVVEIDKPPSEVYGFLMDEENLTLWIKNFIRLEHIDGEPGVVQLQNTFIMKMGVLLSL